MKIIRYENQNGEIGYAAELPSGDTLRLEGDIFSPYRVTREPVQVTRRLAPVSPAAILCIGLN